MKAYKFLPAYQVLFAVWNWAISLAVLYVVGIIGIVYEVSRNVFLELTPFFLLVNVFALIVFQPEKNELRFWLTLIVVFLIGWGIEWLGVHTGFPFGRYEYGWVLGWKVDEVPLLIGFNWILLSLSAAECMRFVLYRNSLSAISAAVLMVALDSVIEPVAITLGYWHWYGNEPPVQNYLAWFAISFLLVTIWFFSLRKRFTHKANPMALVILPLQFIFFISLLWML